MMKKLNGTWAKFMPKLLGAVGIFGGLSICGCQTRHDYLDMQSENTFLKNAGRVVTVISPASFAARVIINEIAKDQAQESALASVKNSANPIGNNSRALSPADTETLARDSSGEPYLLQSAQVSELAAVADETPAVVTAAAPTAPAIAEKTAEIVPAAATNDTPPTADKKTVGETAKPATAVEAPKIVDSTRRDNLENSPKKSATNESSPSETAPIPKRRPRLEITPVAI